MNTANQTIDKYREGESPKKDKNNFKVIRPSRSNQATGGLLLVILAGVYWIYGFGGEVRNATTVAYPTTGLNSTQVPPTQTLLGDLYVLASIFVVIGFGLLLAYFKKATASALLASLFTVSFTVIVSPIFQKFWFNVFITNFQGAAPTIPDPARFLEYSLGGLYIYVDYYNLRIALSNAIAQLVVLLGIFGRLNLSQVVLNSFLFNFLWNLNHFLCAFLVTDSPDSRISDDYQITSVYLFAATYGIIVSRILKNVPTSQTSQFSSTANSSVLAQIGTFFLFLAFSATTTMYSLKYYLISKETQRTYIWQQAFISIFIAMSASIIFNYAFSILLNPNAKIGIRGSLVGTLTGAIMYGPVAGTCINIGAAIAVGLFAGLISAFFYQKIYPKLNESSITDSFGLINIWVVAFLGTFFITPVILKTYYNYSVDLPTLYPQNNPSTSFFISNKDVVGWALVYVGVSIGIGLASGIVVGLILKAVERASTKSFDDAENFKLGSYGLREVKIASHDPYPAPSAQDLAS